MNGNISVSSVFLGRLRRAHASVPFLPALRAKRQMHGCSARAPASVMTNALDDTCYNILQHRMCPVPRTCHAGHTRPDFHDRAERDCVGSYTDTASARLYSGTVQLALAANYRSDVRLSHRGECTRKVDDVRDVRGVTSRPRPDIATPQSTRIRVACDQNHSAVPFQSSQLQRGHSGRQTRSYKN